METGDKIYSIFYIFFVLVFNHDFVIYKVAQKSKPLSRVIIKSY